MLFNEVFLDCVKDGGGIVSVATVSAEGKPHIANTWNKYLILTPEEKILMPCFGFRHTEKNAETQSYVEVVIGSDKVQGKMGMGTGFLDGLHGAFQVPCIIKGIKNADNINAVCHASFNEFRNDIVCIVVIAQEVLTAKQHLQFGILHMAADGAQAFPGIFIQEAKAGVKRSTAPCFECVEAAII